MSVFARRQPRLWASWPDNTKTAQPCPEERLPAAMRRLLVAANLGQLPSSSAGFVEGHAESSLAWPTP
jgi:hypothetical protein